MENDNKKPCRTGGRDIVHRWEGNPIITMDDLSFRASDICNAGAVKIGDTVDVMVTVEELMPEKTQARLACACRVGETVVLDGEALVKVPSR